MPHLYDAVCDCVGDDVGGVGASVVGIAVGADGPDVVGASVGGADGASVGEDAPSHQVPLQAMQCAFESWQKSLRGIAVSSVHQDWRKG